MYIPEDFRESRTEVLHGMMRGIGVATIVSSGALEMDATQVPVEIDSRLGSLGAIRCHFARANPHGQSIADAREVLVLFQGPQGYVSPSWYPSKARDPRVVPTWDYIAVHARGRARLIDDPEELRSHLEALTNRFEASFESPWEVADAPPDFIESMSRGIVGIEIVIESLEGKWKLSQNRSAADCEGVAVGLRSLESENADTLAAGVTEALEQITSGGSR